MTGNVESMLSKLSPSLFLNEYISEAISFLHQHEPSEGYFLAFSGGKDSTVIHHLAVLAGVKFKAYYTNTGLEAPETIRYVKEYYPDVIFLKPNINFFQCIKKHGLPFRNRRWCCTLLKENPSHVIELTHRIVGIRAEESFNRSKYYRITKRCKRTNYYPILTWNEGIVWDFIEYYKLPYNTLYDAGFSRVGCMICPFLTPGKLKQHSEYFSKFYAIFYKRLPEFWDPEKVKLLDYEDFIKWPNWNFKEIYDRKREDGLL